MNNEILGVIIQIALMVGLSYPLGRYIAKVYREDKTCLDFLSSLENAIYRFCGISPNEGMNWKQFSFALLSLSFFWFFWGMILLYFQGALPLNPDGNFGQNASLAFNTSISFMVNCNLQHYAGETQLTYLTQVSVIMFFQFVTAATGMSAFAAVIKGIGGKTTQNLGNFWAYLVRTITRILIPISLVVGIMLILGGVPMSFYGKQTITTLEGLEQNIAQGPTAAIVAIKQLGTNGGGYFGSNSAHPLENPNYFTNVVECVAILLIPMALIWAFGFYLNRRKLGAYIFGVMFAAFIVGVVLSIGSEASGNPNISHMAIAQDAGSMEGKETRFGSEATALWAMATTVTSNGSVNGMHDSLTPLSGMLTLLNMQINCWFGGVGVGFLNYYIFIILAVFLSGLMVGRTPEFLGKKIEAHEMKIAVIIALLHPLCILAGTGIASFMAASNPELKAAWLNNPSFHGLSEMLYEFSSAAANNGSGFEGLNDNTSFWNISTGLVLLFSRFIPIIGPLAIVGSLAAKQHIPESPGTLRADTTTFSLMTFVVIMILAALAFFPVLSLGPIAEFLTLK